jgi:hypothetical protein
MEHALLFNGHKNEINCKKIKVPFGSFSTKLFNKTRFLENVLGQLGTP